MASILKVDTIQDQSGNNIINESADTITIGASGDTITIPSGATFDASSATVTIPAVDLTTSVTGTLPVANGGTNLASGFANGITMAQIWRITASTTATSSPTDLTTNWEIADTAPTGTLGTGLTESSGIFSFPSTGYYWIGCVAGFRNNIGTRNASIQLKATINNSSYSSIAIGECNNSDFGGVDNTSMSAFTQYMFDITDTTNQKFKLTVAADQNQTVDGSSTTQLTGFQIIRLGDT